MEDVNLANPETQPSAKAQKASPSPAPHRPGDVLWNALSLLLLVATLASFVFIGLVFTNPSASYNPFPPPALPPILVLPTVQPTATARPPVSSPTLLPTQPPATATATFPATPTAIQATPLQTLGSIPTLTSTPKSASTFPFVIQGEPKSFDAIGFDPNHSCTWMGVAGRVLDLQNRPAIGLEVQLFGTLGGKLINETSLTGTAHNYGDSGFEFTLANKPIASTQRIWVRLVDQAGVALSENVFFDTYADCPRNLILVNFKQIK
jgi:hypothetical protein